MCRDFQGFTVCGVWEAVGIGCGCCGGGVDRVGKTPGGAHRQGKSTNVRALGFRYADPNRCNLSGEPDPVGAVRYETAVLRTRGMAEASQREVSKNC